MSETKHPQTNGPSLKETIITELDAIKEDFYTISQDIGHHPELGNEEYKSSKLLVDFLERHGFSITMGTVGLETAFEAVYDSGQPGPSIGFMCEYDALPDIGHACGHNLIGTMGMAAGIGLSKVIDQIGGKIFVYGTPAEETRGAKVTMAEEGIYDHLDVAMMVHPSSTYAKSGSSLAMDAIQFEFHGKAAHAAAAPHKGINALDAVIQTFNSINALREHVTSDVRIHGIIPEGGKAANIVPDYAVAQFYVRAKKRANLNEVLEKVKNCARGAALATGAELEISFYEYSYDDMITNDTLSDCFTENLIALGVKEDEIAPPSGGGSLDMGNVSQIVPSIHPFIKISDTPITGHTHEFREASLSRQGFENMFQAAQAMAHTAVDVLTKPDLLEKMKAEFKQQKQANS